MKVVTQLTNKHNVKIGFLQVNRWGLCTTTGESTACRLNGLSTTTSQGLLIFKDEH
jgi:hypothetical protein